MILILEEQPAAVGAAIERSCAKKGLETLRLTPERIIREVSIELYVRSNGCSGTLAAYGRTFSLSEVQGAYCSLDSFPASLWSEFSLADAAYAAMETHAIWLALLSSLSCRPVNPPAPEALGGPVYSAGEIFSAARRSSLPISATACVGLRDAVALSNEPIAARVCDLGCEKQQELPLSALMRGAQASPWRQVLMRERLPAPHTALCIVGGLIFASTWGANVGDPQPVERKALPNQLVERVSNLHARLGLVLAEYQFAKLPDGGWVLDDHSRTPGPMTWAVHSEALVRAILDTMLTPKGILQ